MSVRTADLSSAAEVIEHLGLTPHPEGGWFKETWRAAAAAEDARGAGAEGARGEGTAILFLLEDGQTSHWHSVDASELWLYHSGSSIILRTAQSDGSSAVEERKLGRDLLAGEVVQHLIEPGVWQSAQAVGGWCLVSCVVVPAFEFAGFRLAPPEWSPGKPIDGPARGKSSSGQRTE